VSPHAFDSGPQTVAVDAHSYGRGGSTHVPCSQTIEPVHVPHWLMLPQPSDWAPHACALHACLLHGPHVFENASQTSGLGQDPQSMDAPHPSTNTPHAAPCEAQVSAGHAPHWCVVMSHSWPSGQPPQSVW